VGPRAGLRVLAKRRTPSLPLTGIELSNTVKVKPKIVPVLFFNRSSRHEGLLGEWRYRSTHSLTSALDGDE
jgi:hypothetical protein